MNKDYDKPELLSAFPREDYQTVRAPGQSGMTLRDYFAAKAMQGMLANTSGRTIESRVAKAWAVADAMLAAREVKS